MLSAGVVSLHLQCFTQRGILQDLHYTLLSCMSNGNYVQIFMLIHVKFDGGSQSRPEETGPYVSSVVQYKSEVVVDCNAPSECVK